MTILERRRPQIVAFVGFPGMGKTTFAKLIAEAVGAPRLRLGQFLKARGLAKASEEMGSPQAFYAAMLVHTDLYLAEGIGPALETHGWAILDGFPRSVQEAEALGAFATKVGVALTVFHFDVSDPQARAALSLARQRAREIERGRALNDAWQAGKVRLAEGYDGPCLEALQAQGARIHAIDPEATRSAIERRVRTELRLDFERIPWDRWILEGLRAISETAWLVGEGFFRPFFNGVYGPLQEPRRIEVVVAPQENPGLVKARLQERFPRRWIRTYTEEAYLEWLEIQGGRVRLDARENLQVMLRSGVEASLRRGEVRANVARLPSVVTKWAATDLVRAYPGLSAPFIDHARVPILPNWSAIHEATRALEQGGRRQWAELLPVEAEIAAELRAFLAEASVQPTAPPRPAHNRLPPGVDPWLERDSAFQSWLLEQERSHTRPHGRFARALADVSQVPQKPTHQGWMTDQHVFATLLQLQTLYLPKPFWRALRIAALYHDHGKIQDITTPGAHPLISRRLWLERYVQEWNADLTNDERRVIPFLIANHDLLGRLARGVKEEAFTGGIDPSTCRVRLRESGLPLKVALALVEALNRADIASVAALRWTLPELSFASQLVLKGDKAEKMRGRRMKAGS